MTDIVSVESRFDSDGKQEKNKADAGGDETGTDFTG
jgi:hypothetical protein